MKNVNFVFCELCHEEGRKRTQPIKWAFLDDGAYKFFRCEQHGIDPEFDDSEGWHEWE